MSELRMTKDEVREMIASVVVRSNKMAAAATLDNFASVKMLADGITADCQRISYQATRVAEEPAINGK